VPQPDRTKVVRAIGRWSLAALMINLIIGSGIFGLPSGVAALTGRQSPMTFLIAAAGIAVIAACFAEVASRFRESGGPYLYTRVAFGRLVGLQTGWLNWTSRLAASAASANLFAVYLGEFWPRMREPALRCVAITLLLTLLALVNIRGIRIGTGISNLFTVAKLVPLVAFVVGGCMFLLFRGSVPPAVPESHDISAWLNSILLVIFAYAGFEAALIPAGEVMNPDRDAPIAILTALLICTPIYALVQFVVVQTLASPGNSDRPLAAAAHVFGGPVLAATIAVGVLLSVVGYLAAGMIAGPRIVFALAKQNDFPRLFAAVHPRYKTPHISILAFAVLVWALALLGTFSWNASLSAVSRLITYALTCAALPTLRWKQPGLARFRLPVGPLFALLGVMFCVVVLSRAGRVEVLVLCAVLAVALLNWISVRHQSNEAEGVRRIDPLVIVSAESAAQLSMVRELLLEYWESRDLSLSFFNFDRELAELPGEYAPPFGKLLIASCNGESAGCVALRKLDPQVCEMKRLYLRDKFRGLGFGRSLAEAIIAEGRGMGYRKMRLDTIGPSMQEAFALYRGLGFREIAPYRNNPLEGARYLELDL
jgi:amino acid transporter/predicted GNAT family acetyltransferase